MNFALRNFYCSYQSVVENKGFLGIMQTISCTEIQAVEIVLIIYSAVQSRFTLFDSIMEGGEHADIILYILDEVCNQTYLQLSAKQLQSIVKSCFIIKD